MSRSINTVVISGRLTGDPEAKKIGDFDVTNFRLASNRVVGKQKVEKTVFIDVNAWSGLARVCAEHLTKGSKIAVTGVLCQDSWEGKDGQKNSKIYIEATDITFMDGSKAASDAPAEAVSPKAAPAARLAAPAASSARPVAPKKPAQQPPPPDDDIPF